MPSLSYIPKIVYNGITISLTYPPETDDEEQKEPDITSNTALAGDLQVVYNHTEIKRHVVLSLLTPTQKAALETFFDTWAKFGYEFDYYESDNDTAKQTYSLDPDNFNFTPIRQTYSGLQAGFLYQLEMYFRRAV